MTSKMQIEVRLSAWVEKLFRRILGLKFGCYLILLNKFEEGTTWKVIGPISDIKEEKP